MQPSSLTENESSGVGLNESNTYALIPFAHKTHAASPANSFEKFLESNAITTPLSAPFFPACSPGLHDERCIYSFCYFLHL